jgi:hypothetical protein
MTPYEQAKAKRAQEREADDQRHLYNMFLYLEALFGPLESYQYNQVEVPREEFLWRGHALCMREIRARQRRERAQQRAQRDPAGGEDRHSS